MLAQTILALVSALGQALVLLLATMMRPPLRMEQRHSPMTQVKEQLQGYAPMRQTAATRAVGLVVKATLAASEQVAAEMAAVLSVRAVVKVAAT